jgi:guanyl-specific ribonuclease Sa
MKKYLTGIRKAFAFAAILSAIATSCKKDNNEPVTPLSDNSLPSAAIGNITLLEKNGKTIRFGLDVAVFRDSRNMENSLGQNNFLIDSLKTGGIYGFVRNSVALNNAQSPALYSALMLMDQSGSISSTDPKDYRLDAAKAFCSSLGNGNNVMLWSFAGSSHKMYGTGFTTDTATVIAQIESLRNQESGGTPLYKSQVAATDFTAINATNTGKAVLTFSDGDDTQGGYTPVQVSANATSKNVRLFNIGLGNAQTAMLCRQAVASGGAFMFAKDARQLISMFGNLGKLLDMSARYYHTEWTVTRSSNFSTGSFSHQMRIVLPYGGEITVPFTIDY